MPNLQLMVAVFRNSVERDSLNCSWQTLGALGLLAASRELVRRNGKDMEENERKKENQIPLQTGGKATG